MNPYPGSSFFSAVLLRASPELSMLGDDVIAMVCLNWGRPDPSGEFVTLGRQAGWSDQKIGPDVVGCRRRQPQK